MPLLDKTFIKDYNPVIRDFIWNNKMSKIGLQYLYLPKDQGGLKLVNLQKRDMALKINWIQIYFNNRNKNTSRLCFWRIYMEARLTDKDIKKYFRKTFWMDALIAWHEFRKLKNIDKNTIL